MQNHVEETHQCLALEDGTKYSVTIEGRVMREGMHWSVWVTRANPRGLGQCRLWEVYGLNGGEQAARKTANHFWASIKKDGKRP